MRWPWPLLLLAASCAGREEISLADAGVPDHVCQKSFRIGEDFFWVTQVVDAVGRPKERSARWRSTRAEMAWQIREEGRWFDHPSEVRVEMMLDRVPGEAVSTQLLADGVLVDERVQLSRGQARRHPSGSAILVATFYAPAKVPRLHGVRDLRMKALVPGGTVIGEARLPLPDWSLADRYVEEGRRELETLAQDFASRCEQVTGGEI